MMVIHIRVTAYVQGDDQSVLANTTIPESTLRNKNYSIAYYFVREGVARDEWQSSSVNTHDKKADFLTKLLPSGDKRCGFVCHMLHYIHRWSS